MTTENQYEYRVIKGFAISSLFWGMVGLIVGILISLQPVYPQFNFTPGLPNPDKPEPMYHKAALFIALLCLCTFLRGLSFNGWIPPARFW